MLSNAHPKLSSDRLSQPVLHVPAHLACNSSNACAGQKRGSAELVLTNRSVMLPVTEATHGHEAVSVTSG